MGSSAAARSRRNQTAHITMVVTTAATQAGAIRAAKTAPGTLSLARTSKFLRFDPGRRSDAAFAMNSVP